MQRIVCHFCPSFMSVWDHTVVQSCKTHITARFFKRRPLVAERTSRSAISGGHRLGVCTVRSASPDSCFTHLLCFSQQQSCLSFPAVTSSSSPGCPPSHFPCRAGNELSHRIGVNGGSVGGQGHTCVHCIGACVSPRPVVEVGASISAP